MKICLIIGHFGSVPDWYPLWQESALRNPTIDFHVFTDCSSLATNENIHIHPCGLDIFESRTVFGSSPPKLRTPYKITDFKPMFGEIFEDLLAEYDYWGFGDLDVIYGDIQSVCGASFGNFEYISTGRDGASGPLAFLANTPSITRLWRQIPNVMDRLQSPDFFALDERDFVVLLRAHARCDLVFRECLDDMPARWQDGELTGIRSGRTHALHHFGGRLRHIRAQIAKDGDLLLKTMRQGRPLRIGHEGSVRVESPSVAVRDCVMSALRHVKRGLG